MLSVCAPRAIVVYDVSPFAKSEVNSQSFPSNEVTSVIRRHGFETYTYI